MRRVLVISSLERGGAERTASVLAGAWAARGDKTTIITLRAAETPAYPLHPEIGICVLGQYPGDSKSVFDAILRHIRCIRALRGALKSLNPDVIISFMEASNVLTILATLGMHMPVIITEHTHPAFHQSAWHWRLLRRVLYHRAAALVCMTESVLAWMQQRIRVRGYVIPNPLDASATLNRRRETEHKAGQHIVIAMGRLSKEKGFDLLLEAFARASVLNTDWQLRILGDGPARDLLKAQAQKLNLEDRIELTGAVADPFPILCSADLFVMSSRYEGFGNALCEAMACGLPVISFDCPSGPREIIRDGIDGLLVAPENVTELAAAMDSLMHDAQERRRLAERAPEVISRFSLQSVLALWDPVFEVVVAPPKKTGENK